MNKPFVDYKKLEIYHLSQQFVLDIYALVKNFPDCESNNLVSQITRAATSIPLNIAEGSAAGSYKIFLNYVIFAYRSANEVEAALETSKGLTYFDEPAYSVILEKLNKLIRKIYRYMEYLDKNAGERKWDKSYYYRQQKTYVDQDMKKREEMAKLP